MTAASQILIAGALDHHHAIAFGRCLCGWSAQTKLGESWREQHQEHQAAVIAALPGIAIVTLPDPKPDHNGDRFFDGISYRVSNSGAFHKRVLLDGTWEWALASAERSEAHAAEVLAAARAAGGES